jgi:TolB protein
MRPALTLALLILAAPTGRAADPVQEVICCSRRTGEWNLFRVNLGTGDAKNLTPGKNSALYPAVSPDGTRLAFALRVGDIQDLYVTDAHGRNRGRLTQLTREQAAMSPTWAPDGKRLAYMRVGAKPDPELVAIDADGKNEKVLGSNLGEPCWSPDGKKLLVVTRLDGAFRVGVIDADGKNLKLFETGKANKHGHMHPTWSPDGKRIAFVDMPDQLQQLFVCDADGGRVEQITRLPAHTTCPAWSPDGKWIYFTGTNGLIMVTQRVRPDGTDLQAVDVLGADHSLDVGRVCFLPTAKPLPKVRELSYLPKAEGPKVSGKSLEVCATLEQAEQKLGKAGAAELWKQIDPQAESLVIVGYGEPLCDPAQVTVEHRVADAGGVPAVLFRSRGSPNGLFIREAGRFSGHRFKVFAVPAGAATGWDNTTPTEGRK